MRANARETTSYVTTPPRTKARATQLNVIYFTDSARTHSIQMSMRSFRIIVVLTALLLVGTAGACYALKRAYAENRQLAVQLHESMLTVFEYQTRYEHVYEKAYPQEAVEAPAIVKAAPVSAPPATQANAATVAAALVTAPVMPAAPAQPAIVAAEPTAKQAASETSVDGATPSIASVENTVSKISGRTVEIRFDMRNTSGADKAEGFLWAIAKIDQAGGKVKYLKVPNSLQLNPADANVTNPEKGQRFAIKRFRQKTLSFSSADFSGTVSEIRIGVMGKDGKGRNERRIPTSLKIGRVEAKAAVPSETKNESKADTKAGDESASEPNAEEKPTQESP